MVNKDEYIFFDKQPELDTCYEQRHPACISTYRYGHTFESDVNTLHFSLVIYTLCPEMRDQNYMFSVISSQNLVHRFPNKFAAKLRKRFPAHLTSLHLNSNLVNLKAAVEVR